MRQIIFNEISARELSALPKDLQLELMAEFQLLPQDGEELTRDERFGRVSRDGRSLLRFRTRDYRLYFEAQPEGILIHRILSKNTLKDFFFRTRLPLVEDEAVGEAREFWKLIEEGEKTRRKP